MTVRVATKYSFPRHVRPISGSVRACAVRICGMFSSVKGGANGDVSRAHGVAADNSALAQEGASSHVLGPCHVGQS